MPLVLLVTMSGYVSPARAQYPVPGEAWNAINPDEAIEWSAEHLAAARILADSLGTAAYMLIEDGLVLDSYGDITRNFRAHSIRKSLLSALYGAYLDEVGPYLDATLSQLGINDYAELTPREHRATVQHLLLSRSGVFLPAAYENEAFDRFRPDRGSYEPGAQWYYSNWDFNVAGTVFQLLTGRNVFAAFRDRIADPLGMQDFDLDAMEWRYDRRSWHPAYLFRLSTRDLACFGLLFLREGRWDGRQIEPRPWVERTTRWYSDVARPDGSPLPGAGYGMMWWVHQPPNVPASFGGPIFSAEDTGTQALLVLSALDILFVHRTDTDLPSDEFRAVSHQEIFQLLDLLLAARPAAK